MVIGVAAMPTIKEIRESLGMSQQELSELSDISVPAISRMENGKPVNFTSVRRICKALNVDMKQVTGVNIARRPGTTKK